jgi:hypothetical protein
MRECHWEKWAASPASRPQATRPQSRLPGQCAEAQAGAARRRRGSRGPLNGKGELGFGPWIPVLRRSTLGGMPPLMSNPSCSFLLLRDPQLPRTSTPCNMPAITSAARSTARSSIQ